jgi:hypothetical protein
LAGEQPAIFLASNRGGQQRELREERQDVPDEKHATMCARGLHHAVGIRGRQSNRFFDQHMFCGLQSRDGHIGMLTRRRTDIDQIDGGIGQERFKRFVTSDSGQVHLRSRRSKVAMNACPITPALFGIAAANGRHVSATKAARGEKVDHAHETDAGDADANHALSHN